MGRRRRRRALGPSRVWTYVIFLAVMCTLYYLATGLPPALDKARGIVTDLGREVSLLFQ